MDALVTVGELVVGLEYSMFIVTVRASGLPIRRECRNWFVGRALERLSFGDHLRFLLEPIANHEEAGGTIHHATRIELGHPA